MSIGPIIDVPVMTTVKMKPKTFVFWVGFIVSALIAFVFAISTIALYSEARVGYTAHLSNAIQGNAPTPTWAFLTTIPFAVAGLFGVYMFGKKLLMIGRGQYYK